MSEFKCNLEVGKRCKNSALCHLCDGERLLKLPKERVSRKGPKKKKEGIDFEKKVVKQWNKTLAESSARRQPNSGAIRDRPGDIITPQELFECKERGTLSSRGEKSITIQLNWIEKVKGEMIRANKNHWYIPFGFKNCPEIYLIKEFNHELELLQIIEEQARYIKKLEASLDVKEGIISDMS
jgi:hypothetical protein